jgi:hypothetical protein
LNLEVDIVDNPNELYTAAVEFLTHARNTKEEAEAEAAALVKLVGEARSGEHQLRLEKVRAEMEREESVRRAEAARFHREQWQRRRNTLAWWGVSLFTLALVISGIWLVLWIDGNDYAGYDQKQVGQKASEKLEAWYGDNEMEKLSSLQEIERKRSKLAGKEAWMLRYRQLDGKVLRIYIWETSANNGFAARYEGATK